MGKNLSTLEIVFENVEFVEVPAKYILDMHFGHIDHTVGGGVDDRNRREKLEISHCLTAKIIVITFKRTAKNKVFTSNKDELFQRIRAYNDIVYFKLKYEDGSEEIMHLEWEDYHNYVENGYQTSFLENKGDLVIKVGKFDYDLWLEEGDDCYNVQKR